MMEFVGRAASESPLLAPVAATPLQGHVDPEQHASRTRPKGYTGHPDGTGTVSVARKHSADRPEGVASPEYICIIHLVFNTGNVKRAVTWTKCGLCEYLCRAA